MPAKMTKSTHTVQSPILKWRAQITSFLNQTKEYHLNRLNDYISLSKTLISLWSFSSHKQA